MKAVFVVCNQSMFDAVQDIMKDMGLRGFTGWEELMGCGSRDGEPHLGSHAWPTMNNAMLTFVPDDKVDEIMAQLRAMDEETPDLGLRAFVWDIEKHY